MTDDAEQAVRLAGEHFVRAEEGNLLIQNVSRPGNKHRRDVQGTSVVVLHNDGVTVGVPHGKATSHVRLS